MSVSSRLPWEIAQSQWASQINPVLNNPLNSVSVLKSVALVSGVNKISHKLGRVQQGWFLTDINAAITYYRSEPFNDLSLTLTCSGAAIANIGVF